MTTTDQPCALPPELAALAQSRGWSGQAVKCAIPRPGGRHFGDELSKWILTAGVDDRFEFDGFFVQVGLAEIEWSPRRVDFTFGKTGRVDSHLTDDPYDFIETMWSCCTVEAVNDQQELTRYVHVAFGVYRVVPPTKQMLLVALAARWAAIEGDHETVDDFTRNVLGRARPEEWRDAVISGLLGDWVDCLGHYLTDPELLAVLHAYTAAEHRRWTPLWERRTGGGGKTPSRRVLLTGTAIGEDGLTVQDLLADLLTAEDRALQHRIGDARIHAVLRGLKPDEAAVAARWARSGDTWGQAAAGGGLPESYGERVRRKLHRLGDRHTERALAAAEATR